MLCKFYLSTTRQVTFLCVIHAWHVVNIEKKNTYKNFIVPEIREQTVPVTEIIYILASYFSTSLSKQNL